MRQPQSILELPCDVLSRVLAALSRRTGDLQPALVCRLWRDLCASGSTVALRTRGSRQLSLQVLLRELPPLGPGLESLTIDHGSLLSAGAGEHGLVKCSGLMAILQHCSRLKELDVCVSLFKPERREEGEGGELGVLLPLSAQGEGEAAGMERQPAGAGLPLVFSSLRSLRLYGNLFDLGFLGPCFPQLRTLLLHEDDFDIPPTFDEELDCFEIPSSVSLLVELRELHIRGHIHGTLPPEIGSLQALRRIHIMGSTDHSLPETLCLLPCLTLLHITGCFGSDFGPLPAQLGRLPSLRSLRLQRLSSECVPQSISQVRRLRDLHLSGWPAERDGFWSAEGLACLTSLTIGPEWRERNALPTSAASLGSLIKLTLMGAFAALPDLSGLTALQALELQVSGLSSLAPDALSLPQLQSLRVQSEDLCALFPGGVSVPQLTSLHVAGWGTHRYLVLPTFFQEQWHATRLTSICFEGVQGSGTPVSLGNCAMVEKLVISHCRFQWFPCELLQCPALRCLSVHCPGLALPQDFALDLARLPHLEQLEVDCLFLQPGLMCLGPELHTHGLLSIKAHCFRESSSSSGTSELPLWMTRLTALTDLTVSCRDCLLYIAQGIELVPLQNRKEKPCGLFGPAPDPLKRLQQRRATLGRITELASGRPLPSSFDSLGSLTALEVSHHQGASLPDLEPLSRLQRLKIQDCPRLQALPDYLTQLGRLTALEVQGCNILRSLPASLGALSQLRTLRVASCSSLQALPASLGALVRLQELALENLLSLRTFPDLHGLTSLSKLIVAGCPCLRTFPQGLVLQGTLR